MAKTLRARIIILALAGLAFATSLFLLGSVLEQQPENVENRAYSHVEFLTSIAPRLAGTQAEAIAASYIENEFKSYGLEVWVENFAIENSYVIEEASLFVTSPEQRELDFIPILYSPSAENATGKLTHVVDVSGDHGQLGGSFVLVGRENLDNFVGGLTEPLPLAVLTYYENWPPYSETWTATLSIPLLWISADDAQHLIELLAQENVEFELRFRAKDQSGVSYNVVAVLPGTSDGIIVVNAHHDSVLTPGAVDDASGVAVVLEMARALSAEKFSRTVMFVTFGGKELGLFGSADFVSRHTENTFVAAITIDSIAPGPDDGLRVGLRDTDGLATTEWFDIYIQGLAEELGLTARDEHLSVVEGYSDYYSFTKNDMPGTWIYWTNFEHGQALWPIHTLGDNLDAVDRGRLAQVTSFGTQLIRELAGVTEPSLEWAAFAVIISGVVVVSVAASSFLHYRKGWRWLQAAEVFSAATVALMIVTYLLLLA